MRRLATAASLAATLALAPTAGAATTLTITGGGYGHGIGMSQYGAYGYALHGKDYRFILGHYYQGTSLGRTNPNQTVRVLIATGRASFTGASAAAGQKLKPTVTYTVRTLSGGTLALYDQSGKKVGRFQAPLRVAGSGPLQLVGHGTYRGALEFRPAGSGVETVNALGLDDYVRGVVAAEMPSSWPLQALEAQAVAARTYAITSNVDGNGYQLYPDTRSQAYGGVAAETPSTDAAVAATRGQVVIYHGAPVTTFFFASSGGHTEDIQYVWLGSAPEPWLRGVPDPYDAAGGDPYHQWSYTMSMGAATRALGSLVEGQLVGIQVTRRGASPRVVSAAVVGTRGRVAVSGPQLQGVFNLPSTYMSFSAITTASGAPATTGGQRLLPRHWLAQVQASIASLFDRNELQGSVFPATKDAPIEVQVRTTHGWKRVKRARLNAGGEFAVHVARAGTYRVLYRNAAGPAVRVG